MKIEIKTLNDGRRVLAKTFVNRTQATVAVDQLRSAGFRAFVSHRGGPCFYAALETGTKRWIVTENSEMGQVELWDTNHPSCPAWSDEELHQGLDTAQASAAWMMTCNPNLDLVEIIELPKGSWTAQDARDRIGKGRNGCLASMNVSREYLIALRDGLREWTKTIEDEVAMLP